MAPPRKPGRRIFSMPAAFTTEDPETKREDDVYKILRDHVAFTAAARAETRQVRIELQQMKSEITMKISELSSSVDRLIAAATNLKNQPPPPVPEQPDDPAIEEMNAKIQRAIDVLEGRPTNVLEPTVPPPAGEALATDINTSALDPNAR